MCSSTTQLLWKMGRMAFGGQPTVSTIVSGSVEIRTQVSSAPEHLVEWGRCQRPESYIKRTELVSGQSSLVNVHLG